MTFDKALIALKEGKAVTVGNYAGYYLYNGNTFWRYSSTDKTLAQERLIECDYIKSDKWEIVEDITPLSIPIELDFGIENIKADKNHFWLVFELPYKSEYIKQFSSLKVRLIPEIRGEST